MLFLLLISHIFARIQEIELNNEERSFFPISTFGFFDGGILRLNIKNLSFYQNPRTQYNEEDLDESSKLSTVPKFMLSLVKYDGVGSFYMAERLCTSKENRSLFLEPLLIINFDTDQRLVQVNRYNTESILIGPTLTNISIIPIGIPLGPKYYVPDHSWDVLSLDESGGFYSIDMVAYMGKKSGGEYTLYYHNCKNAFKVSFKADLTEINKNSYLSAGEMPLPMIYVAFTVLYMMATVTWCVILRLSHRGVGPHYMMLTVVVLKTVSLLFLDLNYFFVKTHGLNDPALATIFYITHVMKGAFMVTTIALIGAGWMFIKHILSPCDKRLFLLLIPLQILANVAYVVIEENRQFSRAFKTWKLVFLIVDITCCGILLFPFIHSIRLLQSSPKCDHKSKINLAKLKLFRRFYFLVICYLYLSRVLVYFLNAVLPYQLFWLTVVLSEMITLFFFIVTAWCFHPLRMDKYVAFVEHE